MNPILIKRDKTCKSTGDRPITTVRMILIMTSCWLSTAKILNPIESASEDITPVSAEMSAPIK